MVMGTKLPPLYRRREIRQAAGLNYKEMGELVGVHGSTISSWEKGLKTPWKKNAIRYMEMLEYLAKNITAEKALEAMAEPKGIEPKGVEPEIGTDVINSTIQTRRGAGSDKIQQAILRDHDGTFVRMAEVITKAGHAPEVLDYKGKRWIKRRSSKSEDSGLPVHHYYAEPPREHIMASGTFFGGPLDQETLVFVDQEAPEEYRAQEEWGTWNYARIGFVEDVAVYVPSALAPSKWISADDDAQARRLFGGGIDGL